MSIHIERTPRWVRVRFAGVTIADSKNALLVFEGGGLPKYYFPKADVKTALLVDSSRTTQSKDAGKARWWSIESNGRFAEDAVWAYTSPPAAAQQLKDYIAFEWDKVDGWFEEEKEVFRHARDPYHRVDAVACSRHIKIVLGGEVIAESRRPILVFETGIRTRYYLPRVDVREDLLTPTDSHTRCPYKGEASYWTAKVGGKEYRDIVWSYVSPIAEMPKIAGLYAFYNEKVDAVYVDGEQEPAELRWNRRLTVAS
ncbi:MAG TPA: DUF427 domain-containing protein [Steroidobacter sp.]|nr:DUF427 domain-containing protein [Steroidobacter sp.]